MRPQKLVSLNSIRLPINHLKLHSSPFSPAGIKVVGECLTAWDCMSEFVNKKRKESGTDSSLPLSTHILMFSPSWPQSLHWFSFLVSHIINVTPPRDMLKCFLHSIIAATITESLIQMDHHQRGPTLTQWSTNPWIQSPTTLTFRQAVVQSPALLLLFSRTSL